MDVYRIDRLMAEARKLAAEYRRATGKTLAISGEIAVSDAVALLGLEPATADEVGYDAVRRDAAGETRYQIKPRVVFDRTRRPARLGQLRLEQDWDAVLLVLMDEDYETMDIYEASRSAIEQALDDGKPNARGSLSVARFQRIGQCVWTRASDAGGGEDA